MRALVTRKNEALDSVNITNIFKYVKELYENMYWYIRVYIFEYVYILLFANWGVFQF